MGKCASTCPCFQWKMHHFSSLVLESSSKTIDPITCDFDEDKLPLCTNVISGAKECQESHYGKDGCTLELDGKDIFDERDTGCCIYGTCIASQGRVTSIGGLSACCDDNLSFAGTRWDYGCTQTFQDVEVCLVNCFHLAFWRAPKHGSAVSN